MPEGEGEGGGGVGGGAVFTAAPNANENDSTQWRGRALQAEEKIKELEGALTNLRAELGSAQETLDALRRRREVEQQLIDAKAADVETAMLLVEQALLKQPGIDVGQAVADVKSRKPNLFEPPQPPPAPAGAGAQVEMRYASAVDQAFDKASAAQGNRKSLLGYLRAKRGA